MHRQSNKLDLALADYNKALAIDQGYAAAYLGRGQVYRQQGRALDALNDYNRAIQIQPNNGQAYYNRGLLYQAQSQHNSRSTISPPRSGSSRDRPSPTSARGLSQLALGDTKAAAADLDDAVQAEPESLNAWTSRGLAYERLGDKEKAAGSYAKALNLKKEHDPAKKGFARVGGNGKTYQTF